ncbi:MAG TPA: DUF3450 domain-containing protein [Candidatus Binatia bacterium]|nr:DUF3450 domain-containing protein [Candidatus Binatia bacterium]
MKKPFAIAAAIAAGVLAATVFAADVGTVNTTIGEQVGTEKAAAASQNRINALDDETQRMLDDYRATSREAESLRRYNEQLMLQIKSQQEEMVSIGKQIEQIDRTNREIYPLMNKMVDTLDQFVKLDLPFLQDERARRLGALKEMMPRADVTTAEKYRRILEGYQVEMEYGRTIEAYEGTLGAGDEQRTVNFLRVGRVALLYQTLDGDETGYYDAEKKEFVQKNKYADGVTNGLKIAKKQVAPDLLVVPVLAPKEAK